MLRIRTLRSQAFTRAGERTVIESWVTDGRQKMAANGMVAWQQDATGAREKIVLDRSRRYQEILGFGAALTDGAGYTLSRLEEPARTKLLHSLFDPGEMALNVCRISIGGSDSSRTAYSYDDGIVDPDLTRFSIEKDRVLVLPMLKQVRGYNSDLFLFASPWSPPGWMKSSNTLMGGCMRHTYMPSYADYFLKFLRAYEAEGVPIQAVTVQNEIDNDHDGAMPACAWPQDYEADFVTMYLGPLLERAGHKTRIWIIDHSYDLWGRAIGALETQDVRKYTRGIAWHGYRGKPEWMSRVHSAFPDVQMHWTDGGPDCAAVDYATDWVRWGKTFAEICRNWCRSITVSTLASDERGRPYVGSAPGGRGGMLMVHSQTKEVTCSGMYYALGHYSRFVRRSATRIGSSGDVKNLSHCAFENPNGSLVAVIANAGPARECGLEIGGDLAKISLTENSMTTIRVAQRI